MVSKHNARLKHSQCFAEILLHADKLFEKGGNHIEQGLRLFDENVKNIEIGQAWAARQASLDDDAATLASEYPERGAHCLYLRQKPVERKVWLDTALEVAHTRGFELVEGTLHGKIGLALAEMGEHQKAIEHYSKRIELAEKWKDYEGLGEGACNLGILYDDLNMLDRALECYQYALDLAGKISNRKIIELATGNLGLVYLKQEQFTKALDCFERHLHMAREDGDQWSEGNALTNKGIASLKLQKDGQALECFRNSVTINQRLRDLEGEAKNLSYIGIVLETIGDLNGAVSAYQARIAIAQELNDLHGEAVGSWNLGKILIRQKKYRLGLAYLKKGVDHEKDIGDPAWENDQKTLQEIKARYGITEE